MGKAASLKGAEKKNIGVRTKNRREGNIIGMGVLIKKGREGILRVTEGEQLDG